MSVLENFEGVVRPVFIETGTGQGDTLDHARQVFGRCISMESNPKLFEAAQRRFADANNVVIHRGHSPVILRSLFDYELVKEPVTFWLDAHYHENGDTLGPDGRQCPLLDELRTIVGMPWETSPIILIDDAYMFDPSIPHPGSVYPFWESNESNHAAYNRVHWPKIDEIEALLEGYTRSMRSDRPGEPAYILQYQRG